MSFSNPQKNSKKISLVLKKETQSILLLKEIETSHLDDKLLIATTIGGYFYIIQCAQQSLTLYHQSKVESPICQIAYDRQKKLIYNGDIHGNITTFRLNDKTINDQKFTNEKYCQDLREKEPIIMLAIKQGKILLLNLLDQLKIINQQKMKLEYLIDFKVSITMAISIENPKKYQSLLFISFDNQQPPYGFNCLDIQQFRDTNHLLNEQYKLVLTHSTPQIIHMCYNKSQNLLVCANINNEICIYSHEKINQKSYICQLSLKINTGLNILHLNCFGRYILFVHFNKIEIIDLIEKMKVYETKTSSENFTKLRWCFMYENHKEKSANLVIVKGYHFLYNKESKIGKPTLHLMAVSLQ